MRDPDSIDKIKMDHAAQEAGQELYIGMSAHQLAQWWNKWFMKASHKNLAYKMMVFFGVREEKRR